MSAGCGNPCREILSEYACIMGEEVKKKWLRKREGGGGVEGGGEGRGAKALLL